MSILPPERPSEDAGEGEPSGVRGAEEAARDMFEDIVDAAFAPADLAAMEALDVPRRVVFVHAHPDDETLTTGLTMARYASQAVGVTLVTATRGERGEVIGADDPSDPQHADLAALARRPDRLGEHRARELSVAMEALGVTDHRFLGEDALGPDGLPEPVRYQDSGMAWIRPGVAGPSPEAHPDAFALTDVDAAALHLVRVLRETRPQVVVTYEPGGGYGHPDHVMTHRVTMRAVELAGDPQVASDRGEPWQVARVYWVVTPASVHDRTGELLAERGIDADGVAAAHAMDRPAMVVDDAAVAVEINAPRLVASKVAAMRAHATQVIVANGVYALSNRIWRPIYPSEFYMVAPGVGSNPPPGAVSSGLFDGLA